MEKRAVKVRSPTFNPNYKDRAYSTSEEDCSVLKLSGELELGRLRSGEQLLGSAGISVEAIPLMMGMFGMTGSGKTNTELVLNAQIIDRSPETVAIIFDFAEQLLDGKGIKPQKGLKDHARARYNPREAWNSFRRHSNPLKEGLLGHCTESLANNG